MLIYENIKLKLENVYGSFNLEGRKTGCKRYYNMFSTSLSACFAIVVTLFTHNYTNAVLAYNYESKYRG